MRFRGSATAAPGRIVTPTGEVQRALVGALVLNRFQIERKLGSGGFGTVYRAWDARLERHVAVKVIESGEETGRRVLREAQAAARLNHPGIVTLYELGEESGSAYLVTELVEGETLRRLSLDGDLSDRDVAEVGADLCEALDHAHSRGVVHRDIKPQNVLVCDGRPAREADGLRHRPGPRRRRPDRDRDRCSARSPTWPPSRRRDGLPAPRRTSTRSA